MRVPQSPRVSIIGAGIGGLASAMLLAQHAEVSVFERAPKPGGKLRQQQAGSAWIDAGPTVFTMRDVFEEIFAEAGERLDQHLTLKPAQLLARHAWNHNERLDLFADREQTAEAIGKFSSPAEACRYLDFCAASKRVFDTLEHSFIRSPRPSMLNLFAHAGIGGLGDLMAIKPFSTLWQELGRYFSDPRLRQLFARYATYCGSSPFSAPATLMLVAHVEREGVWLLDGGMYSLVQAMTRIAESRGVKFRYGCDVDAITTDRNEIAGLQLANGERIETDAIILNADTQRFANRILGANITVTALPRKARSLSALTMTFTADASGFPLAHHNVFFSGDYACEFDDIFRRHRLPRSPTIYVCAQDREDGLIASSSPERIFLLVNAPPVGDERSFDPVELAQCEKQIFNRLEQCGLSLNNWRQTATVTTPADFERMFPQTGGALYGRASHGWKASFQRPGVVTKIPGLFLAGGSVHPGPGIPMAALSGRMAAKELLAHLGSKSRLSRAAMPGGTSMH